MKLKLSIITGGLIALSLPLQAQDAPTPISAEAHFGPEHKWDDITKVQVTNLQGESLGRIQDLVLDLTNGRVVEVLVIADQTLGFGGKIIAVPPRAFIPDSENKVYQVNMSLEAFLAAPAFDLDKWSASTQTDQVAATYHYFGQTPYFLTTGEADRTTASGREVVKIGIVERMSKLINIEVDDLQGNRLGRLESLVLDVPNGKILNTEITASYLYMPKANLQTDAGMPQAQPPLTNTLKFSTVIDPKLFSFNDARTALLLDTTKVAYADKPHVIFENGTDGATTGSREEPASVPTMTITNQQGTSASDMSTTAAIYKSLQKVNLDADGRVIVTTYNGWVTLTGPVKTEADKDGIAAVAVAAVNLDKVNDQIVVMAEKQAAL